MPHDIISIFVPPRNKSWRRHCQVTFLRLLRLRQLVAAALSALALVHLIPYKRTVVAGTNGDRGVLSTSRLTDDRAWPEERRGRL